MRRPSMARTMSPDWKPAAAAAEPGCTESMRATVVCLPNTIATEAKITMARMKLAIGPAATIAARWPTDLWKKLWRRSSGGISATALLSGTLAAFSSPWNLT
jgi:hypothetical protein